ncbi:MAG: hypothetical protein WD627_06475, partial [Actinomycetota bacterium]
IDLLWANLCDILGTAATATLVRRAIRRAASNGAELDGVNIDRAAFDYHYSHPDSWHERGNEQASRGLRLLVQELRSLLVDMTGPVVVRRLDRIAPLRRLGMTMGEER